MDLKSADRVLKQVMKNVRDARKRAGLTQADVARIFGMSASAFNNYETSVRTMGITDLVRLPAILNCRITDLLPESVVTDYDRERAANPRLREAQENWKYIPEIAKAGMAGMAKEAKEEAEEEEK